MRYFFKRSLLFIVTFIGKCSALFQYTSLRQEMGRIYRHAYWQTCLGSFGEGSHIYPHVVIHSPYHVKIGSRVNIVEFVHIWGGGGVEIGDNTIIASHVVITSQTHDKYAPVFRDSSKSAPVYIGRNCWIGSGAIILPGVRIGDGSIIGAQAVVTKDVAPGSIVVGIPGRTIEQPYIESGE